MKNKKYLLSRKDHMEWLMTCPDCPDEDYKKMEEEVKGIDRILNRRRTIKNILLFPLTLIILFLITLIEMRRKLK